MSRKKPSQSSGKQTKKNDDASLRASQPSRVAKKKLVRGGKMVFKNHPKKKADLAKGLKKKSANAGKESSAVSNSGGNRGSSAAQSDYTKPVLGFLAKVIVELIGEYLEGFYSTTFMHSWPAAGRSPRVAVDSERVYLITNQGIQALSHVNGKQVDLGSPHCLEYENFQSSQDGCSLFFACKSQAQIAGTNTEPFKRTIEWLVQDKSTESLKSVALENGGTSYSNIEFMLSKNGKTLVSTFLHSLLNIGFTSVYQIEAQGKKALASKKSDFSGLACAISGNGDHILVLDKEKGQLTIHDIREDKRRPVLEIDRVKIPAVSTYALNYNGSKAAFIVNGCKLCILDTDKENSPIKFDQLTTIDIPESILDFVSSLTCDTNGRLYAFKGGNLRLVDLSKREFVSLEETQVPQGHSLQCSAISPSVDFIALLIRSNNKNEYQVIVKRRDTKDTLMHLWGYKS